MHGPRLGIPCLSSRGGCGSVPFPFARPITAIRFWSFGHLAWYAYDTAPLWLAPVSVCRSLTCLRSAHFGSWVGAARDSGSV